MYPYHTKVVLALAMCAVLAGCGEKLDSRQIDFNDGLAYKHGSTDPFTGTVVYKNSIPDTLVNYWAANVSAYGDKSADHVLTGCVQHFTKGVVDGAAECDGVGGDVALTLNFKDERYDGISKIYNPETGKIFKVLPWDEGHLNGEVKVYDYDNQQELTDADWEDGKLISGKVTDNKGVFQFDDGKKNGEATLYFPVDGKTIIGKGEYKNDQRVGAWEDWLYSGSQLAYTTWLDTLLRTNGAFFGGFELKIRHVKSNWVDGQLDGEISFYDSNEALLAQATVKDGVLGSQRIIQTPPTDH